MRFVQTVASAVFVVHVLTAMDMERLAVKELFVNSVVVHLLTHSVSCTIVTPSSRHPTSRTAATKMKSDDSRYAVNDSLLVRTGTSSDAIPITPRSIIAVKTTANQKIWSTCVAKSVMRFSFQENMVAPAPEHERHRKFRVVA